MLLMPEPKKESDALKSLSLKSVYGFSGKVPNGHILHPLETYRLYPLGANIVVSKVSDESSKSKTLQLNPSNSNCLDIHGSKEFLASHDNEITCIAISSCGKYVASGQSTFLGFQAPIIVWDFSTRKSIYHLTLHKVKVEALAFSPSGRYLASLGGIDDNAIIIWDLQTGEPLCGHPASRDSSGPASCLKYFNNDEYSFVTGGDANLRIWELNVNTRKIKPSEIEMGQLKRVFLCIAIDSTDNFMYCGTSSGDIVKVSIKARLLTSSGPKKDAVSQFFFFFFCFQMILNFSYKNS
jgi:cilia- and flagella-associated protein 52